ncbi:hypothetical protein LWM68_09295 [Niabella sp. W65]|nr:hypothetical protein [Niabella sp. W65]MCH7362945.1 hypothetical protein [Niabella sp. W65]ULT38889.1 hypothetical protein KRR40_27970 [Niabella sp. I65]
MRLPFGTNLSSLTPSVALPATAALSPAAGATINFTGDVKYRITNGNLYKDYTVKALITPR